MTKTPTTPGIGASATTPTLAFALILLAAGAASAQVSRPAGPTLANVKWHCFRRWFATRPPLQTPSTRYPNHWRVSIYPLLVWVPFFVPTLACRHFRTFRAGLNCRADPAPRLPPSMEQHSLAFHSRKLVGPWMPKASGARWTTERETPLLKVDLDVIYGHVSHWRQGLQGPVRDGRRSTTRPHVRHHSGRTVAVQTKARPLGPTGRSRLACRAWTQVGTASGWRGRWVWRRSRSGSVGGGPR